MQVNETKGVLEWLKDAWPFLASVASAFLAWMFGRRLQEANVIKTEAEARRTLAEAERIFSDSRGDMAEDVAQNMGAVISAWRTLNEKQVEDNAKIKEELIEVRTVARESKARITALEAQRREDLAHQERLEDLLALAITFIDTLIQELKAVDITPPQMPKRLATYLKERNGNGRNGSSE